MFFVQILKGLGAHFSEVQILNGLGAKEGKDSDLA